MQLFILVFSAFLLLFYCCIIIYYWKSWLSIPVYKPSLTDFSTKVTVIIPARNEEKNIENCLESLKNQQYSAKNIEIIVVNDFSTDNTVQIVEDFQATNVLLINLSDHINLPINSYKKKAIEIAIQKSTGELIICTDADCLMNPYWIQTVVSFYNERDSKFIVMPVRLKSNGSFLQNFQTLDFLSLQAITAGAVHNKSLSMCNGANLAYKKAAFIEVNGFKNIDHVASGDDMLLMHKIAKKYPNNIDYLLSDKVIVDSLPMLTTGSFLNQRIRWASKADIYSDKKIIALLALIYLFNFWLLVLPFLAIAFPNIELISLSTFKSWILLLAGKTILEILFLQTPAKFFSLQKTLRWFVLAQPFHILYTVIAGWLGKFGSYQWKDRTVK